MNEAKGELVPGVVKFYKDEKGWGAITVPSLGADAWVSFAELPRDTLSIAAGTPVLVRVDRAQQDSFEYVASDVVMVLPSQVAD